MPTLKNISPLGHIDVPLIGREGGPVAYYACKDGRCTNPSHPNFGEDPDHEHQLVTPEGAGPGVGCLVPGEEFEVSPEHAKALLEHEDNFVAVKSPTKKKDD